MSVENINLFHSVLGEALERLGKTNLNLNESQYEAVKADTICILPTGYGKSLIHQLLPFVLDYLGYENTSSSIILISPLNALMVDQITKHDIAVGSIYE